MTRSIDTYIDIWFSLSMYTIACFQLLVSVYDSGAPGREDQTTLVININRNLNTPRFNQTNYQDTVYDYEPVGSSVLTVYATDSDITSPENMIMYSIRESNTLLSTRMFAIHPISGLITVNRELTAETLNNYRVSLDVTCQILH